MSHLQMACPLQKGEHAAKGKEHGDRDSGDFRCMI